MAMIGALKKAILSHVRIPVTPNSVFVTGITTSPHFCDIFRPFSSQGGHITEEEVTERILAILKDFPKLDPSKTPLDSSYVDVAVFCLSLMGTDFPSYIMEAHRVLKPSGWLLIAEVKSRFDTNTGGADPNKFEKAICELGFSTNSKDFSNKMFIMLYFKKKAGNFTTKFSMSSFIKKVEDLTPQQSTTIENVGFGKQKIFSTLYLVPLMNRSKAWTVA